MIWILILFLYSISTVVLLGCIIYPYLFSDQGIPDESMSFPNVMLLLTCLVISPLTWFGLLCLMLSERINSRNRIKANLILGKYNLIDVAYKNEEDHLVQQVNKMSDEELQFLLKLNKDTYTLPITLRKAVIDVVIERKIFG